jgi:hypothetical protein
VVRCGIRCSNSLSHSIMNAVRTCESRAGTAGPAPAGPCGTSPMPAILPPAPPAPAYSAIVMNVLLRLGTYSPNGAHGANPALAYSARAGANSGIDPVSRLTRR